MPGLAQQVTISGFVASLALQETDSRRQASDALPQVMKGRLIVTVADSSPSRHSPLILLTIFGPCRTVISSKRHALGFGSSHLRCVYVKAQPFAP